MTEEQLRKELDESQSKLLKSEKDNKSLQKRLERAERLLAKSTNYNEDLCIQIEELSQKLAKYKNKKVDVASQTTYETIVADTSYNNWVEEATAKQVSVAESVTAAAQEAMQEIGLTYDENSGMYYDYTTGYYYNEDRSFYYDPSCGVYYYYDLQTHSYQFYSHTDPTTWAEENIKVKKKRKKKKIKDEDKIKEESIEGKPEASDNDNRPKTVSESETELNGRKLEDENNKIKPEAQLNEKKPEADCEVNRPEAESKTKAEFKERKSENKCKIKKSQTEDVSISDNLLKERKSENKCKINMSQTEDENTSDILTYLASHDSDTEIKDEIRSDSNVSQEELKCNVISQENDKEDISVELSDNEDAALEEGECSTTTSISDSSTDDDSSSEEDKEEEIKECWPPCIRIMVVESTVLAIGTLFIVTTSGATIGREEPNDIYIPDAQVSKIHASFQFDESQWKYSIIDLGSQNTTLLNSSPLSQPKTKSEPHVVNHGDELVIGSTKLVLHIHDSTDTCDMCEPGLVQALNRTKEIKEIAVLSKEEKEKMRRKELKQIKKRFGLESSHHEGNEKIDCKGYKDRSAQRRRIKGSDVPHEKKIEVEPASVHKAISSENKGFKMMEKMGWTTGEGLGKDATGIVNPVEVGIRSGQSGLGSSHSITLSMDHVSNVPKLKILNKTIERYYASTPKKMKTNK